VLPQTIEFPGFGAPGPLLGLLEVHDPPRQRGDVIGETLGAGALAPSSDHRKGSVRMLEDLRKFLLRGNVIDLAVAVIIGIAFGAVITSLVNDVIMAIVGAIFGKPNFDDLTFSIGDGIVYYGRFLTAVLNFVIIGTALFVVVRIAEQVFRREEESKPTEIDLLTEIRDELRARPRA
jgi:large conductance mechanosensitive channel